MDLQPLHIFKPGRHVALSGQSLTFGEADLAAIAQGYDPSLHEAPLVVGHPRLDAPAYGWVKSVAYADGALTATPDQVDTAFAEMVNAGRFKKISASFYAPTAPGNPKPGAYYLRHVGFLGAQPPAVKGLRTPAFSEAEEGVVTVEFGEADPPSDSPTHQEATVTPEEKAALEAENARLKQQLADAETQRQADATAQRHQANAAFAETLVQAGKLPPKDKDLVAAVLDFAESGEAVEFGEGDAKQPLAKAIRTFLGGLPKQIDFSERTAAETGDEGSVSFAAPSGYAVDNAQLLLHRKAEAYRKQHKVDFATAFKAVGGR